MIPTPAQFRAARAWLDWTREGAAHRAGLNPGTVGAIERGSPRVKATSAELLRGAYVAAGLDLSSGAVTRSAPFPARPSA